MFKGMLRRAMETVHELEETKRIRAYRELDKQLKTNESYEDYVLALDRATKDIRERAAVAAKKRYDEAKPKPLFKDVTVDFRYNTPKEAPKASEEDVHKAIQNNDIYRNVQQRLLGVQHKQVAYGLDKYPEPLNQDTWSQIETIDHILDETIDQAHYLMMLKIKLEEQLEAELELMNRAYSDAGCRVETTRDMQGADFDGDVHRVVKETTVK